MHDHVGDVLWYMTRKLSTAKAPTREVPCHDHVAGFRYAVEVPAGIH